jgi:hypothetical protein
VWLWDAVLTARYENSVTLSVGSAVYKFFNLMAASPNVILSFTIVTRIAFCLIYSGHFLSVVRC